MTLKIEQAADWLLAERSQRRMFAPLPEALAPASDNEAYLVQAALQARLEAEAGPLAGAKIALTTKVMQEMCRYHRPVAAGILARNIHVSPYEVPHADFVRIGVECEVAVRLGAPLRRGGRPHDRDSVADAVSALHVGIELVDDRAADYNELDAMTLIADNALNRGIVLGPPISDWRALDLPAASGEIRINGESKGSGKASDVMGGHPFAALAWLANHWTAREQVLPAGAIIMTGSLVATQFPKAGQTVIAAIAGLGEAEVRFT